MTALTEHESGWVSEVAGRLRLIQVTAASAPKEKRREYFQEIVANSLKALAPTSRKRHLEALLARFPVAGHVVTVVAASPPPAPVLAAPPPPPPPPPKPETPEQIFERFLAAAAAVSDEQRAVFSRRLADVGLAHVDRDSLVLDVSEKLRQSLGLDEGQQPQLTRLVELAIFLVDALCMLDQQALKTMEKLSARSSLLKRDPREFRKAAARFLVSEDGDSLEPHWRAMRGLLGALLAAMQGGGRDFGRQYVERLSPSAIEDVVRAEGGGRSFMGPNVKERCWDKFRGLAEDYATADLVDRRIKDSLAAFVERTLSGR